MTEPHKRFQNSIEDNEQLIARYQEMLIRQVESAYKQQEMEPDIYIHFLSKVCEETTREGIQAYYKAAFDELADYHEERLQERIIKGAEYIESIGKDHKNYAAAIKKYDLLCSRLHEHRQRRA